MADVMYEIYFACNNLMPYAATRRCRWGLGLEVCLSVPRVLIMIFSDFRYELRLCVDCGLRIGFATISPVYWCPLWRKVRSCPYSSNKYHKTVYRGFSRQLTVCPYTPEYRGNPPQKISSVKAQHLTVNHLLGIPFSVKWPTPEKTSGVTNKH